MEFDDPREKRGYKIYLEGSIEGSMEEGFTATNSKGKTYTVNLLSEIEGTCTCTDFAFGHGRLCKHIHAALFLANKQIGTV